MKSSFAFFVCATVVQLCVAFMDLGYILHLTDHVYCCSYDCYTMKYFCHLLASKFISRLGLIECGVQFTKIVARISGQVYCIWIQLFLFEIDGRKTIILH